VVSAIGVDTADVVHRLARQPCLVRRDDELAKEGNRQPAGMPGRRTAIGACIGPLCRGFRAERHATHARPHGGRERRGAIRRPGGRLQSAACRRGVQPQEHLRRPRRARAAGRLDGDRTDVAARLDQRHGAGPARPVMEIPWAGPARRHRQREGDAARGAAHHHAGARRREARLRGVH